MFIPMIVMTIIRRIKKVFIEDKQRERQLIMSLILMLWKMLNNHF